MCPAQPDHVHAHTLARLSLPVKDKLRLLPWLSLFGLNNTPSDELDKAPLCKSEGYSTTPNHAWFDALAVKYEVQKYAPIGWSFAAKVLMLNCYCLLESCGLLLACPSPPGLTPACPSPPGKLLVSFWCLPFSSWSGATPPCHLLQLLGIRSLGLFVGWYLVLWKNYVLLVALVLAEMTVFTLF
jgi:hypothetical protein